VAEEEVAAEEEAVIDGEVSVLPLGAI